MATVTFPASDGDWQYQRGPLASVRLVNLGASY